MSFLKNLNVYDFVIAFSIVSLHSLQPTFGSEIKTPPNNRKPVVLLQLSASSCSVCTDSGTIIEDADKTQCPDTTGFLSLH